MLLYIIYIKQCNKRRFPREWSLFMAYIKPHRHHIDALIALLCTALLFFAPSSALSEDNTPGLKWIFPKEGVPSIDRNGNVFIGGVDGVLYAMNDDGTVKGSNKLGNASISRPLTFSDNGTIYIRNNSGSGSIVALNTDGTLKWKYGTRFYWQGSIAVGKDGTAYVGSQDGYLYAFSADGNVKWQYRTGSEFDEYNPIVGHGSLNSSPCIGPDGSLYASNYYNTLFALTAWGTLKWKFEATAMASFSPAVDEQGTVYFMCNDNVLWALNDDGSVKWQLPDMNGYKTSPVIAADGTVYAGAGGSIYAIARDGTVKWRYASDYTAQCDELAIGEDGAIYFGSRNCVLQALNPDGTLRWTFKEGEPAYSAPFIARDGTVYISGDRCVYAIRTDSHGYQEHAPWPCYMSNFSRSAETGSPPAPVLYAVRGMVVDSNSVPVIGEAVICNDGLTVFTNSQGYYSFRLTDGTYSLSFRKDYAKQQEISDFTVDGHDTYLGMTVIPKHVLRGRMHIDGEPLEVTMRCRDYAILTNRDGRFAYTLASGRYTFEVELYHSYFPRIFTIEIEDSDVDIGDFNINKELWRYYFNGVAFKGSPAIGIDNELFLAGTDGVLNKFRENSDTSLNLTSADSFDSDVYQPSIDVDGTVYVPCGNSMNALSVDGAVLWSFPVDEKYVEYAPAIDGDGNIYFSSYSHCYSLDKSGKLRWNIKTDTRAVGSPTLDNRGKVYFAGKNRVLYAFGTSGEMAWTFGKNVEFNYSPVTDGLGHIYCVCISNRIYVLNEDGTEKWVFMTAGMINETIVIDEDLTVYCSDTLATVYCINSDGTLRWSHQDDTNVIRKPSMFLGEHGELIVRLNTWELLKFDKTGSCELWEPNSECQAADTLTPGGVLIRFMDFGTVGQPRTCFTGTQTNMHGYRKNAPWPCYRGNNRRTGQPSVFASVFVDDRENNADDTKPAEITIRPAMPNPFNASSIITFNLSRQAFVTAEIYNVLGSRIALLTEKEFPAGVHRITWEPNGVASGLYFYRLSVPNSSVTGKMLYIR